MSMCFTGGTKLVLLFSFFLYRRFLFPADNFSLSLSPWSQFHCRKNVLFHRQFPCLVFTWVEGNQEVKDSKKTHLCILFLFTWAELLPSLFLTSMLICCFSVLSVTQIGQCGNVIPTTKTTLMNKGNFTTIKSKGLQLSIKCKLY